MRRMSRWMGIGCVGALLLSAAGAKAAPINLVTNGGFEEQGSLGYANPPGWTYTSADISPNAYVVDSGLEHSGDYAYAFKSTGFSGRGDIISQDIPTTPGAQYTLSLYVRNDAPLSNNGVFLVWWGALEGVAIEGSRGSDFGHHAYSQLTFTVTGGPGASTLLGFEAQSAGGGPFLLDDVSITPVPEPASLGLLGLGAAGLLLKRRRG